MTKVVIHIVYISPAGIPPCPQARAMYAIDLLLQWRNNDDKGWLVSCFMFELSIFQSYR